MKIMLFLWVVPAVLAACVGCENDAPGKRYDKIATGYCECTAQLVALNREAAALANDTTGRAAAIFRQMEAEHGKAKECAATIVSQYGKLQPADFAPVQQALTTKCPDLAEQRDLLEEMLGE